MQRAELAISLMEHPMIRAIYESKIFHPSIINEIIVQEILREEEAEEATTDTTQSTEEEGTSILPTVIGLGQGLAGWVQKACEIISSILNWVSLGVLGLGLLLATPTAGASIPVAMAFAYALDVASTGFDFAAAIFALLAGNFRDAFSNFLVGLIGLVMSTLSAGGGGSASKVATKAAVKSVYKRAAKEVAEQGVEQAVKTATREVTKNKVERTVKDVAKKIVGKSEDEELEQGDVDTAIATVDVEAEEGINELTKEFKQEVDKANQSFNQEGQELIDSLGGKNQQEIAQINEVAKQASEAHQQKVKQRQEQIAIAFEQHNNGEEITAITEDGVAQAKEAEMQKITNGIAALEQAGIPEDKLPEVPEDSMLSNTRDAIESTVKGVFEFLGISNDEEEDGEEDLQQDAGIEQRWQQFLGTLSEPQKTQYAWYGERMGDLAKEAIINRSEEQASKILEKYIQRINKMNAIQPEGAPDGFNLLIQTYFLAQNNQQSEQANLQEQEEATAAETEEATTDTQPAAEPSGEVQAEPLISDDIYEKLPIDAAQVQALKDYVQGNREEVEQILKTQQPKEEGEVNVEQDFQAPAPNLPDVSASWQEVMDSFFGLNVSETGFMTQYLLRDQAEMLNGLLTTLSQIKAGTTNPEEQLALTNVNSNLEEQQEEPFEDSEETLQVPEPVKKLMRQHLESMVSSLKTVREDVRLYEKYATRTSADPRYDGSSLKRKMDRSLEGIQAVIKDLINDIKAAVEDRRNMDAAEAEVITQTRDKIRPAGDEEAETVQEILRIFESFELVEEEGEDSERQQKIAHVEEVYKELMRMYQNGLKPALQQNDLKSSRQNGGEMLGYLLEDKEFLGYFPRTLIAKGNKVMTLGQASESLSTMIKAFINVIRDMVPVTKTQEVSKPTLNQASIELKTIADAIQNMFGVEAQYDENFMKAKVKESAQEEGNQSLTDFPSEPEEEDSKEVKEFKQKSEKLKKALLNPERDNEILQTINMYIPESNLPSDALERKKNTESVSQVAMLYFDLLDKNSSLEPKTFYRDFMNKTIPKSPLSQMNWTIHRRLFNYDMEKEKTVELLGFLKGNKKELQKLYKPSEEEDTGTVTESLKSIVEQMLKEHYNY